MSYNEINELRKKGLIKEALIIAEKDYALAPGKLEGTNLFWCLYDEFKLLSGDEANAILERMRHLFDKHASYNEAMQKALARAEHQLSPEGKLEKQGWDIYHQLQTSDPATAIDSCKSLLMQYINLNLPKPSLLHSLIMIEALKIKKAMPERFSFAKFLDIWGWGNLREDDWLPRPSRDGTFKVPSIAEKIIHEYINEMHSSGTMPSDSFVAFLNEAIQRTTKNRHLQRYAAQALAKQGKREEAVGAFKKLIIEMPEKFYLWVDLADTVDNPHVRIGLLCGAIMAGGNEDIVSNIRLMLADQLCNVQLFGNALNELMRYEQVHMQKGWQLRSKYFAILNRIPRGIAVVDNHPLYASYKALANEFIYSDLPGTIVVKTWEKKEYYNGKMVISWQMRHDKESMWIKPRRFHLDFNSKNGSLFDAKIVDGKVVWMQPIEDNNDITWLRRTRGILKLDPNDTPNGRTAGDIDGVFVPPYLIYGHSEGDTLEVLAILNNDGRWNALSVRS